MEVSSSKNKNLAQQCTFQKVWKIGAEYKSQLLGGMVKTVGDEFYGSALTFILVSTYFGKKKFKIDALYHLNLPHPLLLQIDKNGLETLMKPWA